MQSTPTLGLILVLADADFNNAAHRSQFLRMYPVIDPSAIAGESWLHSYNKHATDKTHHNDDAAQQMMNAAQLSTVLDQTRLPSTFLIPLHKCPTSLSHCKPQGHKKPKLLCTTSAAAGRQQWDLSVPSCSYVLPANSFYQHITTLPPQASCTTTPHLFVMTHTSTRRVAVAGLLLTNP
jgi:hypothetical protein